MADSASHGDLAHGSREDEFLVIRCQLGERAAFDELIDRWHVRLWQYARRLTGSDEAADDSTQDIWLRVRRDLGQLRDRSRLRAWLYGIARRVLMDRLRIRYATPLEASIENLDLPAAADSNADIDDIGLMEEELERLPVIEREMLVLFYLNDLSLNEIADVAGIPVGTVKSRLHRARHMLRQQLIAQGVTP
ncbi:MAG: RNA polymerase sigma factor [Acidobacteria bacterium]|nr:RNA polymerase sigma factor [Acidobacteriota bacterium]